MIELKPETLDRSLEKLQTIRMENYDTVESFVNVLKKLNIGGFRYKKVDEKGNPVFSITSPKIAYKGAEVAELVYMPSSNVFYFDTRMNKDPDYRISLLVVFSVMEDQLLERARNPPQSSLDKWTGKEQRKLVKWM